MKKMLCLVLALAMLISASAVSFSAVVAPTHWYGEVDEIDGIQVTDATQIQLYLASQTELSKLRLILADFDGDGDVSVLDATGIQLYLAKLPSNRRMDEYIYSLPTVEGLIANYSSTKAMANVPVEFTVTTSMFWGDERAYPLSYECYISQEEVGESELIYSGDNATFTYTFPQAGLYYIDIRAYSAFGDWSSDRVQFEVAEKPEEEPFVASVSSIKFMYTEGEEREFVAFAHGGNGPYEYCFVEGDRIVQDYSEKNTLTLEACADIDYFYDVKLTVYVRDADGNVVSDTCEYTLCPNLPA